MWSWTRCRVGPAGPEYLNIILVEFQAIEAACTEMADGLLDAHIVVDALQGGAGTSTNMNVNEALANRALQVADKPLGDYASISSLEHINLHQSTNDTYWTLPGIGPVDKLRALTNGPFTAFSAAER